MPTDTCGAATAGSLCRRIRMKWWQSRWCSGWWNRSSQPRRYMPTARKSHRWHHRAVCLRMPRSLPTGRAMSSPSSTVSVRPSTAVLSLYLFTRFFVLIAYPIFQSPFRFVEAILSGDRWSVYKKHMNGRSGYMNGKGACEGNYPSHITNNCQMHPVSWKKTVLGCIYFHRCILFSRIRHFRMHLFLQMHPISEKTAFQDAFPSLISLFKKEVIFSTNTGRQFEIFSDPFV